MHALHEPPTENFSFASEHQVDLWSGKGRVKSALSNEEQHQANEEVFRSMKPHLWKSWFSMLGVLRLFWLLVTLILPFPPGSC